MSPFEAPRQAAWQGSDHAAPEPRFLAQSLAQALEEVAARFPTAPALVQDGHETDFATLLALARGLAAQILAAGAPPGPIALLLGPSPISVAAWFACAMAGRPFLLLEPANPPERNRMLAAKAGATLAVQEGAVLAGPSLTPSGQLGTAPGPGLDPDAPAMIFPTSGSTGEPKLITYAARTLQVKLRASQELMRVAPGDRVLIAGSHANYGFLHHALVFLLAGGALCLVDVKSAGLPGLYAAIEGAGVRHIRFTPSLFRLAAARPEGRAALAVLRGLRFSGEPLLTADLDLARGIVAPDALIQNVYGSTESALFLWTDDRAQSLSPGTVPIGRIYPLSRFQLRDEAGRPATEGELVIRSRHHALGDWQGGRVDGSRFPPAPQGPGRLYATGDIVRMEPSGDLVVLGRADRVVKVNGQRVSLDEIEAHVAGLPGIDQAAVVVQDRPSGNPLVAFVVGQPCDVQGLLTRDLPAHMIPGRVEWRAALPLLAGGKTDRKALSASLGPAVAAPMAAADDLGAIFARLLKLPAVGPDADFFSLGGDSLLMLDLQLEVEARFGIRFDPRAFIPRASLRNLARLIGQPLAAPPTVGRAEGVELSFRRIRPGAAGVAMVLPGVTGGAGVETWEAAGALPDHALWACDAAFARGRTSDPPNGQRVVEAATRAIAQGKAPQPALLAGYSIAGYIGWALALQLEARPKVVMLDSWPLHRLAKYRAETPMPRPDPGLQALLLACDAPAGLGLPNGSKRRWQPEDGPLLRRLVPTLDHIEISKRDVMTACAPTIAAFAAGGPLPPLPRRLPTMGGRILRLWKENAAPGKVDDLVASRRGLRGLEARLALLYLAVLRGSPALARELAAELARTAEDNAALAAAPRIVADLPEQAPPVDLATLGQRRTRAAVAPATLRWAVQQRINA